MASDIESDEVFDEEDLSDGFDSNIIEAEDGEVAEDGIDVDEDALDELDGDDVADDSPTEVLPLVAEDEDDLSLDQDVELALDEVLAETMRLTTEIEDDEDTAPDVDDKSDPTETILPKQDDEFRCSSCRLLKKMSQMADKSKSLCRDCV
jgi:hypothetical protein